MGPYSIKQVHSSERNAPKTGFFSKNYFLFILFISFVIQFSHLFFVIVYLHSIFSVKVHFVMVWCRFPDLVSTYFELCRRCFRLTTQR